MSHLETFLVLSIGGMASLFIHADITGFTFYLGASWGLLLHWLMNRGK